MYMNLESRNKAPQNVFISMMKDYIKGEDKMDVKEKVKVIVDALNDKKGIDVKVIDISKVSVVADYFIIASGSNKNQVQAMTDNVEEELAKLKVSRNHVEGYTSGDWILMDYDDVIIHVFNEEHRLFYDLEKIWRDGEVVEF